MESDGMELIGEPASRSAIGSPLLSGGPQSSSLEDTDRMSILSSSASAASGLSSDAPSSTRR